MPSFHATVPPRTRGLFRGAGAVAVLLLVSLLAAPGAAAQSAEELLQQANAALQKNDYAAAATALEAYLPLQPRDYLARFNLALSYSRTHRQPEAIRRYQEVLSQKSDLLPAHMNLGILLLQAGNAADALEQFQWVADRQPDDWAAQINRAAALIALNRKPEARQAYEQALRLKPDDAQTQLAYAKLLPPEESDATEEHVRRALTLDPSLEEARLILAGLLEKRAEQGADSAKASELQEAAELYQKLVDAHPERTELRLHLASVLLAQDRGADAIRQLEAARAASAPSYALNYTLLQAYLGAKQDDRALALIPDMLAQDDNNADKNAELYFILGTLRMQNRQYDLAAAAFEHAVALDPQSADDYKNLASALYFMKDYAGAVAALEHVAALGKDNAGSYFLRAITLERLDQKAAALENYQRFLATNEEKGSDQEWQAQQRVIALQRELKR